MNSGLISINLQLEELYYSDSGVMGNIWFEMDGYSFPARGWNDFAETITSWWVQELIDAFRSNNKWSEKRLLFMDGPFGIVLRNGSPVTIHFMRDGALKNSRPISLPTFARTVITCRRILLQHAVTAGWRKSAYADLELCDWLETLIIQDEEKARRPVI